MFNGTSWFFRILYFLTAMAPAYFLFILTQLKLNVLILLGILVITFFCTLLLKSIIKKRGTEGIEISEYRISKLKTKNGEIPSFLLGVVFPSVIGGVDKISVNLTIFITLQLCLFLLMIKSSSILPNALLILIGLNVFEMEDGKFILSFRKNLADVNEQTISITRLGDSINCNTYVRKKE